MADKDIKTVKIPIIDINSVQKDGNALLRYRVVSKDKNKKSSWSKIEKVVLVDSDGGFSYLNGYSAQFLVDNHPGSAVGYDNLATSADFMESEITRPKTGTNTFIYSWTPNETFATTKNFDIYLSWKDATTNWTDWQFAGTTSANSFSFQRPNLNSSYQFVQAAVTVSAFPKLTNIGDNSGISILLSLSKILYIFYSLTGTVSSAAGPDSSGFYTATVGSLSTPYQTPNSVNNFIGFNITATPAASAPVGSFGSGVVTVTGRPSSTSITVRSNSPFTNGNVIDIKV
jgi:hypothetical protein